MSIQISEKDISVLDNIAKQYGLSLADFGKAIVTHARMKTRGKHRQFRVSEHEYDLIFQKAKMKGTTVSNYCEEACRVFLEHGKVDEKFFCQRIYGGDRTKRIAVRFNNLETERKLLNKANRLNIDVGTLLRHCVLTY